MDFGRKNEQLESHIAMINAVALVITNMIARHRRQKDPVIRATLLFEKLCTICDLITATMGTVNRDLPEESQKKMMDITETLQTELNFVMDWINSPIYSPDHPFGQNLMNSCEKSFEESSSKEKEHKR